MPAYITRVATSDDAPAIARIYNQGIEDRVATFETEARTSADIAAAWFRPGALLMVAEAPGAEVVAFAAAFPYSTRPCYDRIREFRSIRHANIADGVQAGLFSRR